MDSKMNRFALIGAAGYIAPRHMRAIKDVGSELALAYDPNDSVGIIDSFFPKADFFTEFEQFERAFFESRNAGSPVDWVSICSPNYLHESHCGFALRSGSDAICEKPLVLDSAGVDRLAALESETGRRIQTILQLRLHDAVMRLKQKVDAGNDIHDVDLTYITSRGKWYYASWKGDNRKSGGVAANIGIHFFDMLQYVFGPVSKSEAHWRDETRAGGYLELEKARVRWFLSIDSDDLPEKAKGIRTTHRSITVDGEELEMSEGFTELHTRSYEEILAGRGFGLETVRPCIDLVTEFRNAPLERNGEIHPSVAAYLG